MDKIVLFIYNIMSTIQLILDAAVYLLFQPIFILIQLIDQIAAQWANEEEETGEPECKEPPHIAGFHANTNEMEEINKIKTELNK